jgi:DNA repair protein RadA/Sms
MARVRHGYRCGGCGAASARWAGRCPSCGEWNALFEERAPRQAPNHRLVSVSPAAPSVWPPSGPGAEGPVALSEVDVVAAAPSATGLAELDRVLGGGLVPGSVTLLGGEPGVGKSTLLLQVLRAATGGGGRALLVCAEESPRQVRLRAQRLGELPETLFLLPDTDVSSVPGAAAEVDASLVVVDSVQAMRDPSVAGSAGSVAQVRACAEVLVSLAKSTDVPVVLVGHVTKDGSLAGPRLLEHMVDTVLTVEGDRHHALRSVRAVKHRFGPAGELGLFEMGDTGLAAVADPYRLLLGDRRLGQPGSIVLSAVEGRRPLLVEVQALVVGAAGGDFAPRRQAQGLDGGRLSLLLAVLERRLELGVGRSDVFTSVVGGIRVSEPAADLAVVLALVSAMHRRPVADDLVAFGEVGLGGEVRRVPDAPRRLAEAARLGFRRALVPAGSGDAPVGIDVVEVDDVCHATAWALVA